MKISTADKYFSLCLREEHNHTCEMCGKTGRMETSHVYSRRHRTIRWCKDNANCLCSACHRKWHESPLNSSRWFEEKFGERRMEILREKRDSRIKVSKLEEKEIGKYYKSEYERMLSQRGMGYKRVTFVSYQ